MTVELSKADIDAMAAKGWHSPVEYCRMFHPDWFPSKMPWVHRGLAALRTRQADFLLDFGEEWWPEDVLAGVPSRWDLADLIKLVTNFVIQVSPPKYNDGQLVEKEVVKPVFELTWNRKGEILGIRILEERDNNAFILPRGYSKTTLLNALNERDLNYGVEPFILYVSETSTHADNQLMTVKRQLEDNALLRAVFGNQVPDRNSSDKWRDDDIELLNGTRMASLGTGKQLRGTSRDAQRPSRIVVDDFQDSEQCRNSPPQREKDLRWFVQVLLPARQIFGAKTTKVDVVGTMPHPEAVIALLMKDPDWMPVRFGARDRQAEMLWPYAIDEVKLEKIRAQFERLGQLDAFDYEYMSEIPVNDGISFKMDKITYVNRPDDWFVAKALVCDPAISDNPKADFFALACVGIGNYGKIHVQDFYAELGVEFHDQAEKFFEFHFAHMIGLPPAQAVHGVEAISYQRALKSEIENKQHEKSRIWGERAFFEVIPILHGKTAKKLRVQGIFMPRVRAGHVSMDRNFGVLTGQMRDWGTAGAKDDGPDAVAMGIGLLDPFSPLSGMVPDENGEPESIVDAIKGQLFGGRQWRKAP